MNEENTDITEIIEIDDLVFEYAREDEDTVVRAVDGVSLRVPRGSFTAVVGRNGSGKSTLAKNVNALLLPSGGRVIVDGYDTMDDAVLWEIRRRVGMVFQNPDNQLVSAVVEDDVAFGPENLGIPQDEIRVRIRDALEAVAMYDHRKMAPHMLSGGQKQRVAIAGVVAMRPEIIVFDEPTAMLDPEGRGEVLEIIEHLHREGVTVVLITHFMEEAVRSDRIIVMDRGRVAADGTPREVFSHTQEIEALGLRLPFAVEISARLRERGLNVPQGLLEARELTDWLIAQNETTASVKSIERIPSQESASTIKKNDPEQSDARVAESSDIAGAESSNITGIGARAVSNDSARTEQSDAHVAESSDAPDRFAIRAEHLTHTYNRGLAYETTAVDDISFTIVEGEFIGIIGHTGSGKSTLIQHLNGILKADSGKIFIGDAEITDKKTKMTEIRKKVGLVFQYPEYQLFEETVYKDIAFGPKNLGLSEQEVDSRVKEAMALVNISFNDFAQRSPFELSGGQKRRVAIAGVIAMRPSVLILDEPSAGLDPKAHADILNMIRSIRTRTGSTILLVSHNMNDIAEMSDRVFVMDHGRLARAGRPEEVFSDTEFLSGIGLGIPMAAEAANVLATHRIVSEHIVLTKAELVDFVAARFTKENPVLPPAISKHTDLETAQDDAPEFTPEIGGTP